MGAGWRAALAGCALALLGACAQLVPQTMGLRTGWPEGVPLKTQLDAVPFFPQDDYQCGPAALATVLAYSGAPATPEPLVKQVWLPSRKGSLQVEMLAAPRQWGRVAYLLRADYADLLREVAAGNPVVVLQDVGLVGTSWHYAVVNGFDYDAAELYLRSGRKARQAIPFTAFERTWIKGGYWAMVTVPPDRIPATATEAGWLAAVSGLARAGQPQAAAEAYATALRRWPDSLPAAIGLANQHHARGSLMEAAAVLRQALVRHPQSPIAMNNLAQTVSDLGRQGEALALIERARAAPGTFGNEIGETHKLILRRLEEQKAARR